MSSPPPKISGIHLIGSIPLSSTEEVFQTVCSSLPDQIRRLPDGETGERWYFATWQVGILEQWPLLFNPLIRSLRKLEGYPDVSDSEKKEVLKSLGQELETKYDVAALESWEVFRRLKKQGVIPGNVKFLVALPSPLTITALFVRREFQREFEVLYEAAILRSLRRLEAVIPKEQFCVQWDCPLEFGMLDKADLPDRHLEKWWEGEESMLEGVVARLARLCGSVSEGVEVGMHFCYGDMQGKHFIQPKDTGTMIDVAKGVLERCEREVAFIHMPVPKDRPDLEYFEPLAGLSKYIGQGFELCLGLIHSDDSEGNEQRIHSAGKFVPTFSVSTECGLGRVSKERLWTILDMLGAVAKPRL